MTDRQTDRIAKSSHTYARVVNTNNTDTVVVCQEYFFSELHAVFKRAHKFETKFCGSVSAC